MYGLGWVLYIQGVPKVWITILPVYFKSKNLITATSTKALRVLKEFTKHDRIEINSLGEGFRATVTMASTEIYLWK